MSASSALSSPPLAAKVSFTEYWCDTQLRMVTCNYTWTIHNFSFYRNRKSETLKSSLFSAGTDSELKWRLHLHTNGDCEESKDHVSMFLRLESCDKPEITATFKFAIINAKGNETHSVERERHRFKRVEDHWGSFGSKKFIAVASLLGARATLLPDDKLTVFCSIKAFKQIVHVSGLSEKMRDVDLPPCTLSEDIGSLLRMKHFCDVAFTVDDEKFYAHKVILAARSPVFAAMYNGERMRDLQLSNIEDVKATAFAEMLHYIYTGKSPRLEELASDLLVAANKYGLGKLVVMCEEQLCKNLAVENAADYLILADRYRAEKLKVNARHFIINHMEEVKSTVGFKDMTHSHPNLLVDTLSFLAMKINGNFK